MTKDHSDLLNKGIGGAVGGAGVLLGVALLVWLVKLIFRVSTGVARRASEIATSTAAEDLARAAGSVAGLAERKSRKLRDAFNQGRGDRS
jgi:hypothetical protein